MGKGVFRSSRTDLSYRVFAAALFLHRFQLFMCFLIGFCRRELLRKLSRCEVGGEMTESVFMYAILTVGISIDVELDIEM